jgi:predicted RNase H-like HicB family nuclease
MQTYKTIDGFSINLILDEDGDWLAHFVELPNISAFGKTQDKAIEELNLAWALFKESCREHGDPIPIPPRKEKI